MNTKHTPGPWYADPTKSFYVTAQGGTQVIASCDRQANARLTAAAPDLLEALRMAAGFIESGESAGPSFFEVRQAWRNAIAKVQA